MNKAEMNVAVPPDSLVGPETALTVMPGVSLSMLTRATLPGVIAA